MFHQNCFRGPFQSITLDLLLMTSFFCVIGVHTATNGQVLTDKVYTKKGQLLVNGINRVPVGTLKAITYRLEQVELPTPILINRDLNLTANTALRITITLDSSINGAYTIWIDDQGFPGMPISRNEIAALIIGDYRFQKDATISLARGTACDVRDESVLPEKLSLPEELAESRKPLDESGNFVTHIRHVSSADGQKGYVEFALATNASFPVQNQGMVLQIGDKHFAMDGYTANPNMLVFVLKAERFAELDDGSLIKVMYGECSFLGIRFGRLNKALLDQ